MSDNKKTDELKGCLKGKHRFTTLYHRKTTYGYFERIRWCKVCGAIGVHNLFDDDRQEALGKPKTFLLYERGENEQSENPSKL